MFEKKKLEDENSIDSSLDASQRLKLVSVLLIYDFLKAYLEQLILSFS